MRKLNPEQSVIISNWKPGKTGDRLLEGYMVNWNNIVTIGKKTNLSISSVAASESEEAQTQTFMIGGFGQSLHLIAKKLQIFFVEEHSWKGGP